MNRRISRISIALAVLAVWLSGSRPSGADVHDLPLLPAGQHAALWQQWVPLDPPVEDQLASHREEAIALGMDVGLFHNGWAALEPAPGVFNEELLLSDLQDLRDSGLLPMVTVSAVDIEDLDVPADLLDPGNPDQLANRMRLDDPIVLARHAAFLDWLVPHIVAFDGFMLAVGVEVNARCDDAHPEEADETINFLIAARDHVRTLAPDLAVAMTVTSAAALTDAPCGRGVLAASDVGSFTYYHVNPIFYNVLPLSRISENFTALVDSVPGRQVVIQELGCPSGFENRPSFIGSTPEIQRLCFETFFREMELRPEIRVAVPFIQANFPEPYIIQVTRIVLQGIPRFFQKRFAEGWATMGLCRETDGTCKPAWDEFLEAIEGFEAGGG